MAKKDSAKQDDLTLRREASLITPTDLGSKASKNIAGGMNGILADVFALYLKTKNFHWHMSGPHFRDYHLLLDEQADQLMVVAEMHQKNRRFDLALDRAYRANSTHQRQ